MEEGKKAATKHQGHKRSLNLKTFLFPLFSFCLFAEPRWEEVTDKIKIPIIKEMHRVMKYLMNMTEMAAESLCLVRAEPTCSGWSFYLQVKIHI